MFFIIYYYYVYLINIKKYNFGYYCTMKKKINKKFLYLGFSLIFMISLGFLFLSSAKDKDDNSVENSLSLVMQARLANSSFDYKKAESFYKKAYKKDPYNANLVEEYLLFSIMQRDFKQSFVLAQKVVIKNHQHFLANLVILVEDIKVNGIDSAIANLSSSSIEQDSLMDIILNTLTSYKAMEENKISEFEEINAITKVFAPDFYMYEKALLNLLNKRDDIAKQDFFNLNNEYVNIESIVYYSKLLHQQGDKKGATNYFVDYLSDNFLTNQRAEQYIQSPIKINESMVISDLMFRISKLMSMDINPVYVYSDSIVISNISLMLDPNNIPAMVDIASFYEAVGDYNNALALYTNLPKDSYYSRIVSQNVIDIYKELGEKDKSILYISGQIKDDSDNAKLFVELGLIHHKDKNYDLAITNYSKALVISEKNDYKIGNWLSYFFRGISYDKAGNWDLAEADMLEAKRINPEDPILINYLAYSWISRDKNIDEALTMLETAIKDTPENPNILDSYSWGLFKSKKYEQALEYSEKANSIISYDPILVNHLGDILWQLGYKKDAIGSWAKALNLSPDEELGLEISSKLQANLPSYLDKNIEEKTGYVSFIQRAKSDK